MPRIKSAKKRVEVAERNRLRNVAFKSSVRTAIKKALSATDPAVMAETLKQAYSLIDRGVLKGIIHKNTAARYKSRVAVSIHQRQQSA